MHARIVFIIVLVPMLGCTSTRLERSTIEQAGTLTELQYQQVLNNLAMFCTNPGALPWHVNLRDGSAQIADLGSAQVILDWHRAITTHPQLLGSRTVVEQWGMDPVTDDLELKILRIAYRRALGFQDTLSGTDLENDLADDLAHELKKQTQDLDEFTDETNRQVEEARARYLNAKMRTLQPWDLLNFGKISDVVFPYKFLYGDDRRERVDRMDEVPYIKLFDKIVSVTDERIVLPGETLSDETELYTDLKKDTYRKPVFFNYEISEKLTKLPWYHPHYTKKMYVTPMAAEVRRQVKDVQSDLMKINTGWFGRGCKKDIPKDACYVGHYRDCYVWVRPNGVEELTDFTLKILSFTSLIKESTILTTPGPRYTPSSGFPSL
jgi:hypothetical protein